MPRLLFLTERFPPDLGGLAASSGRISRAICDLGWEVDVLIWSRLLQPGEVRRGDSEPGVPGLRVFRFGRFRHWDMTLPLSLNLVEGMHRARPYDAVWGHYLFPAGFQAVWFGKLAGIPSTVSLRGNDIDREMFPPGDMARLTWTLERADAITSVSNDLARKVEMLGGRGDTIVLKNAVDADVFSPGPPDLELRRSLGIHDDEIVLGFSGELREKKGQKHLLDALAAVQAQRPACLLLIGEVRPSAVPALQVGLPGQPGAERVLVTGHIEEPAAVAAHLRLCDFYLQPSLWDGLPNALLEAMACGLAVVASDAGGIPDAVTHGEDGFLIPRWDLHRLGEALLEILDHPEEADLPRIRAAARARMLAEFSPSAERERLRAVLSTLTGAATTPAAATRR
jgi:glycosyltransferase involved in cell wall biosynthesis